jgi:hypothetical protein
VVKGNRNGEKRTSGTRLFSRKGAKVAKEGKNTTPAVLFYLKLLSLRLSGLCERRS